MQSVAVIVPVYQSIPSEKEYACFKNNCAILGYDTIILAAPKGLDISHYTIHPEIKVEFFNPDFFKGIAGYNRLMLSEEFYLRFINFEYILICQLDVFVFKNELKLWCNKGFDYIGAPWVNNRFTILLYVSVKTGILNAFQLLFTRKSNNCVGNGGFSLRKTKTFFESLVENKEKAEKWKANEDFYWSFFATLNDKPLSVPSFIEASLFSIEKNPEILLKLNKNKFPMAIHAWERYNPVFWKTVLNEHGYNF